MDFKTCVNHGIVVILGELFKLNNMLKEDRENSQLREWRKLEFKKIIAINCKRQLIEYNMIIWSSLNFPYLVRIGFQG